ncbi:hypothetical protein GOP47_0015390 [Adiantum capillus-veneris]|uniref:GPI ethanolamine phosphate transferase 3 n=1 Tax=Adiantum capillus-veneris TaxID=13818 RepID=A0A9D4UKA6_ADICA|nr:hypothetical protein GOP47_0015390 [Adiantum capillus-veneris]
MGRFDFVAPSSLLKDKKRPWMDRLQVVQKLISEESSRARLFKFIADPPTTSLQRLKGLTTGSLPTFIDVGNSFGAPAIVEDNIIKQLTSNGKKVIMMGDDTWLDLFPSQFFQAFPFPSFNVKDLHTVDNGVLENLFPALYEDNWDVLIGHFLGVDHVGHIFGVESTQMVEKLEQYNKVVEDVIAILRNESQKHDETLLLVLGDHGQTLNGDHGGGTLEEVETALFAWSAQQPTHPVSQSCDSSCISYLDIPPSLVRESNYCICNFQQLDFAATFAALIGIPFPYGSIGKVDPQLFGLVARMWQPSQHNNTDMDEDKMPMVEWQKVYNTVLCLNSWQVNRYFQQYSKSSINGFSPYDLDILHTFYNDAQSFSREWSVRAANLDAEMALLSSGLARYTKYLQAAAALARSKWTKFSDGLMTYGVLVVLISLLIQIKAIYMLFVLGSASLPAKFEDYRNVLPLQEMITDGFIFGLMSAGASTVVYILVHVIFGGSLFSKPQFVMISLGGTILGTAKSYLFKETLQSTCYTKNRMLRNCWTKWFAYPNLIGLLAVFFCCIHACSLLSNSFILREQQVVTFFLVSLGFLDLRMAMQQKSKVLQALCFVVLNFIMSALSGLNFLKENGYQTRETTSGMSISSHTPSIWQFVFAVSTVHVPFIAIGCAFVKSLWRSYFFSRRYSKVVVLCGLSCTYAAICLHWLLDDLNTLKFLCIPGPCQKFARLLIPRAVYSIVAFLTLLVLCNIMDTKIHSEIQLKTFFEEASLALVAVLSSLILLLLGRHGPIIALTAGLEAWCLLEKQSLYASPQHYQADKKQSLYTSPQHCQVDIKAAVDYLPATIQWSLFATQVFFCTGHRCAFDGLHYAAAFIGFDHFSIYRQGTLLALDTFGASHILPILSLPLLVAKRAPPLRITWSNQFYKMQISQALLTFDLVRTITAAFTTVCVTIQRRHLMVWGLFAPKFVFDAIGLLVTDVLVLFAFLSVIWPSLH